MIVTNAGRASNARICLRDMVICTPRVSPGGKRPRDLTSMYQDRLDTCPTVVKMDPESNYIVLEHTAPARD
jgi:hypothetical protein